MVSYQNLLKYLKHQRNYSVSIKKKYFVISIPQNSYHITVFQDQWDDYEKESKKPYHLFHVSSNDEQKRCSTYFWVAKSNNMVQNIPKEDFSYNQPSYSFYSSTRSPCIVANIEKLMEHFQKLLTKIPK